MNKTIKMTAVLSAVCIICIMGYFSYYKWIAPPSKTETADSLTFVNANFNAKQPKDAAYAETIPKAVKASVPLSTDETINHIITVLTGKEDLIDASSIDITYERDTRWNRELAVAALTLNNRLITITLDKATGYLLKISDWGVAALTDADLGRKESAVLAAATKWYESLPYRQGYQFHNVQKISNDAWMYSFCNTVTVEFDGVPTSLVNPYEEVRITVNPSSGAFILSNAFYVPLLDEYRPNEQPLDKASAIAAAKEAVSDRNWTITADAAICLPTWTDGEPSEDPAYPDHTRLSWAITFCEENDSAPENAVKTVYIDFFTGEILSVSTPK